MMVKRLLPLPVSIALLLLAGALVLVLLKATAGKDAGPENNRPASLSKSSHEPGSPSRTRSSIQQMRPTQPDDENFETLGEIAAGKGIEHVIQLLSGLKPMADREDFIHGAFHHAAALGPGVALDWAKRLKPGHPRDTALMTLLCDWSGRTVGEWLAQPEFMSRGIAVSLGSFLLESGKASHQEIFAYSREFTSGKSLGDLIGQLAAKLAPESPSMAYEMGNSLNTEAFTSFTESFIRHWAKVDFEGAKRWVVSNEGNLDLSKTLDRLMSNLSDNDIREAANCLGLFAPDSEERRNQITKLAAVWSIRDIEGAFDWAESLSLPVERAEALDTIQATTPVGIGAAIHGNAIMAVLPDSPASHAGLAEGDRVLALTSPDGGWVETTGLESVDIVRNIRGRPNSRIDLRIQTKTGEVRTVTVTRRQIYTLRQP